jgi:hypothetical protein
MFDLQPPRHISTLPWLCDNALARFGNRSAGSEERGRAAFDELKQGIREINFLSEPESGEIKFGRQKGSPQSCRQSLKASQNDIPK